MARNKRPALTSPWKIGFLVSLLLVAVGIGVGFYLTRSFGLTWSWIEFHGTWTEFTFHREAFMVEMLPLAGLVTVMALFAYLIITGAVRKYRAYLDSGVDYKRLIQALGKVEDLSDEGEIRKLSNHPELRTFLLNLRTNVMERQKALDAREVVLAEREADASHSDVFATEVDALISAIIASPDAGFPGEVGMTVPELKRVERAIREHLVDTAAGQAQEQVEEMRADLERTAASLLAKLEEIRDEMAQSEQSARELETEVSTLRIHASAAGPAPVGDSAERAVSRLDGISEVLKSLGEETRSVAINSALRASSSDASVDAIVQLADDVRAVAAKYNGVAAQWDEASAEARQAFVAGGRSGGGSPHVSESLDVLSNKVCMWAERAVILAEKVKTFEQHFVETVVDAARKPEAEVAVEATPPQSSDWGLEPTAVRPSGIDAADSSESRGQGAPDTLAFEKQESLFSEITGSKDEEPGMFADIPAPESVSSDQRPAAEPLLDTTDVSLEPTVPEADNSVEDDFDDTEDTPNAPAEYVIDEEPLQTGSAIDELIATPSPSAASRTMHAIELDSPATATMAEEEAIDLYALGAVEYEPGNIHHNA